MFIKFTKITLLITLPFLFGCKNKRLCHECESDELIHVVFDWQEDVPKQLMTVLFYSHNGEFVKKYQIPEEGMYINIPPGDYIATCYNTSSSSQWSGESSFNTLFLTTQIVASEPKTEIKESLYVCGDTKKDVAVKDDYSGLQTITFTPEQITYKYTYILKGIPELQFISVNLISIYNLNSGYSPSGNSNNIKECEIKFSDNIIDIDNDIITGSIYSFGLFPGSNCYMDIKLYLFNEFPIDVPPKDITNQIQSAKDPHNVEIKLLFSPIHDGGYEIIDDPDLTMPSQLNHFCY